MRRKHVSALAALVAGAMLVVIAAASVASAADCRPCAMSTTIAACQVCVFNFNGSNADAWCSENQPVCTGQAKASPVSKPSVARPSWNEQNCEWLCTSIYGSQGSGACIARNNCAQYRGNNSASKSTLRQRLRNYCSRNSCPGQQS